MDTPTLVYKYKLANNKLDSQDFIDLPLPTILMILNTSIIQYVDAIYGIQNTFRQGVESFQRRIDDLQPLVVNDYPEITYISKGNNTFTGDLPEDYLHLLRSYTLATKDKCTDRALKNIEYSQDELNDILVSKDPYKYPSFEWQEQPYSQAQDKIYIYTDGSYTPTKLIIKYLKKPTEVDIAGYTKIDGSLSTDADSELPDYLLEDIVILAAKYTKAILQDIQGVQLLSTVLANPK